MRRRVQSTARKGQLFEELHVGACGVAAKLSHRDCRVGWLQDMCVAACFRFVPCVLIQIIIDTRKESCKFSIR